MLALLLATVLLQTGGGFAPGPPATTTVQWVDGGHVIVDNQYVALPIYDAGVWILNPTLATVLDGGYTTVGGYVNADIEGWVVIDGGATVFQGAPPWLMSQYGAWQIWDNLDGGFLTSIKNPVNIVGWVASDGGSVQVSNFPAGFNVNNYPNDQQVHGWVVLDGGLSVSQLDGTKATYAATCLNVPPPAPFFVSYFCALRGSATKTVRVTRVSLSGTETTAGIRTFALVVGGGLSGGDAGVTNNTAAAFDSSSSGATAQLTSFSNGTTPGASPATIIRGWTVFVAGAASTSSPTQIAEQFGNGPEQAIVLRGTNQYLIFALVGGAMTGGALSASVTWTEE